MHMMHKILHAENGMDPEQWFEKASAGERTTRRAADPFNIKPKYGCLKLRRNFFLVRVGEDWNKIPTEVKVTLELQDSREPTGKSERERHTLQAKRG
jgi:hypothetical protein